MECLRSSPPVHCFGTPSKLRSKTHFPKLISLNNSTFSHSIITREKKSFKLFVATSPFETETETETAATEEKFEWYSEWYPVMPVCDLDKRVPHGKRVIGIDVVVWWDRNESQWRVFDDSCPHRLAPLSEGRIDGSGRLQCVYHGWCFGGSGDCQLIPQAPPDGPPVQRSKKACAIAYPSTVQNDIVWFWPDADPRHKDILATKKPPYIPELDDPSFAKQISNREFPYGYEVLIENLMDPAHVPYAHYGIMRGPPSKKPVDREGGMPLDLAVERLDATGFDGKRNPGTKKFFAPCVYYSSIPIGWDRQSSNETKSKAGQKNLLMVFICVPVSPGRSRLIWSFPRNFAVLVEKLVPRWVSHINQNLILDSDLNLLHLEERSILEAGDWQKACFMPTKSDGHVIAFRKWLHKFAGGQVDWRGKFTGALPPTPPREQLLDRYWTHVVNCSSCRRAYKSLKVLKVALQIASFCVIGVVAATKQNIVSTPVKVALVSAAILCFAASKWLAYFLRKFFHFHDYSHALR